MTNTDLRIKLLELQVAALRSVLSEFEGDKNEYTQMIAADAFATALLSVKYDGAPSAPKSRVECRVNFNTIDLDTHEAYDPSMKRYTAVRDGILDINVIGAHSPPKLNNFTTIPVYTHIVNSDTKVYRAGVLAGDSIDFPVDLKTFVVRLY